MDTARERERERKQREKKHKPINRRIQKAKRGSITVSIEPGQSQASKFFNKWIREQLGKDIPDE